MCSHNDGEQKKALNKLPAIVVVVEVVLVVVEAALAVVGVVLVVVVVQSGPEVRKHLQQWQQRQQLKCGQLETWTNLMLPMMVGKYLFQAD